MAQDEMFEIDRLSLELYLELRILRCAITNLDNDLEVLDLTDFVENIYKTSNAIRTIFANSYN